MHLLKYCELQDVFHCINLVAKSLNIELNEDSLRSVNTYGDLKQFFFNEIENKLEDSCTSQQAFYKIKIAISATTNYPYELALDTPLHDIFPNSKRRRLIDLFSKALGTDLGLTRFPGWLNKLILVLFVFLIISFFISWKLAVSVIVLIYLSFKAGDKFSKTLSYRTVKDLVEVFSLNFYAKARRHPDTYNKQEVENLLKHYFMLELDLEESILTDDAVFEWDRQEVS